MVCQSTKLMDKMTNIYINVSRCVCSEEGCIVCSCLLHGCCICKLLQLRLLDERKQLCISFGYIAHSCLIWKCVTHCLFYNALLQTGLLFMCLIIVQPNENVY